MNKLLFFLVILISITSTSVAQSLSQVDSKNGFKDFKLGDLKSKWASSISFQKSTDKVNVYKYTGSCCQQMFNFDIEQILLCFSKTENKLVVIAITTPVKNYKYLDEYFLKYYEDGFKATFGRPQQIDHNSKYSNDLEEYTYTWQGIKTSIDLHAYYGTSIDGKMRADINIFDNKFLQAISSKQFGAGF